MVWRSQNAAIQSQIVQQFLGYLNSPLNLEKSSSNISLSARLGTPKRSARQNAWAGTKTLTICLLYIGIIWIILPIRYKVYNTPKPWTTKVLNPQNMGYVTFKNEGNVGSHDIGIPINQPGFNGFRCSARVARYGVSAVVMMFIFPWPATRWNVGKRRIAMKVWICLCVRARWANKSHQPWFQWGETIPE